MIHIYLLYCHLSYNVWSVQKHSCTHVVKWNERTVSTGTWSPSILLYTVRITEYTSNILQCTTNYCDTCLLCCYVQLGPQTVQIMS